MTAGRRAQSLPRLWYRPRLAPVLVALLPLAWIFGAIAGCRRRLYRLGVLRAPVLAVPVVVVGNLTVGGSGKTPLVLWLVERLRENGWRPGIISRGYGGKSGGESGEKSAAPQAVGATSDPAFCGDEPLLLARRSGVPVFVGRDRPAVAAALLAAHPRVDVIISDDGMQHYRLRRQVEIAVFDERGAGNGRLLPAGPLREPLSRLAEVSAVVWNSTASGAASARGELDRAARALPQFVMRLQGARFVALADATQSCTAAELAGKRLYAIAGIGDPARFFRQLEGLGLAFSAHAFPDHHAYSAQDLAFARDGVMLMTEKDAVKCAPLCAAHVAPPEAWVLPVAAQIDAPLAGPALIDVILEKLHGRPLA